MQLYAISTSYKPLEIQSNDSISQEQKEKAKEFLKQRESGGFKGEVYLAPDSYEEASKYLGGFLCNAETMSNKTSKLSFKENAQDSALSSVAIEKMQDYRQTTHKSSINTFGGYTIDENGFMGIDFLKAAGLPEEYKIHSNALQALHDYYTTPLKREENYLAAEFESIDLIAGISYAYNKIQGITKGEFGSKDAYSKTEIKQMFESNPFFSDSLFHTPLMRDYQNEKGEFSVEGILLTFAFSSDSFAKAESPFTKLSEFGKFQRGMPSTYRPDDLDSTRKQQTPEEIKKEMEDSLMEYYLKAIERNENQTKDLSKEVNDFVNAIIRDSLESMEKLHKL